MAPAEEGAHGYPAQGVTVKPQLATASQGGVKQRTTTAAGKPLNGVQVGTTGHPQVNKSEGDIGYLNMTYTDTTPQMGSLQVECQHPCVFACLHLGSQVTRS